MKRRGCPYHIDTSRAVARIAAAFMAASAVVRCVYYAIRGLQTAGEAVIYLGLPVLSAMWMLFVIFYRRGARAAWSYASVIAGVVFFAVKATTFASPLHTALCLCLYAGVLVLYGLILFGVIPVKQLLYPLFGLPLLYHIFVEDMQIYILAEPTPPLLEWLPEISVLCIMAGLLALSFALKRK